MKYIKNWKVYVHINLINNKKYVGVTSRVDPNLRWKNGYGYKENDYFYSSIKKYGWDNFEHIILYDDLFEDEAKDLERFLISAWNTMDRDCGYNMTSGGDGTPDYHPSEDVRKRLSESHKNENLSEEAKANRANGLKNRRLSQEHKRKIGEGNSKPVSMFSKSGEYIKTFKSSREAEIELGINHSHISQCCYGKRKTTGGYQWAFA
ncbi:MAG: GIY-YIG nuclease family protein [Clostridia bacterium]|nr:GIY-YIG nuclease family protein [Clostridia bacterium]